MELHREWMKIYGSTFRYRVFFNLPRFFTADLGAISYILGHPETFYKPATARKNLTDMLGNGLLVAEGSDHRRQRKILQASFSPAAIRNMVPVFFEKAYELRDKINTLIEDDTIPASPTPPKPEDVVSGARKIDMMKYLGQTTVDVIGLTGFDYDFKALSEPKNELAEAYRAMFTAGQNPTPLGLLQAFLPLFKYIASFPVYTGLEDVLTDVE